MYTIFKNEDGKWMATIKESYNPFMNGYTIQDLAKDANIDITKPIDYTKLNEILSRKLGFGIWVGKFGGLHELGQPTNDNYFKLLNHLKSNKQHLRKCLLCYLSAK